MTSFTLKAVQLRDFRRADAGTWIYDKITDIGSDGDAGKHFDIIALLVDAEGQKAFGSYFAESCESGPAQAAKWCSGVLSNPR